MVATSTTNGLIARSYIRYSTSRTPSGGGLNASHTPVTHMRMAPTVAPIRCARPWSVHRDIQMRPAVAKLNGTWNQSIIVSASAIDKERTITTPTSPIERSSRTMWTRLLRRNCHTANVSLPHDDDVRTCSSSSVYDSPGASAAFPRRRARTPGCTDLDGRRRARYQNVSPQASRAGGSTSRDEL